MRREPVSEERREEILTYVTDVQNEYKKFLKKLELLQTDSQALRTVSDIIERHEFYLNDQWKKKMAHDPDYDPAKHKWRISPEKAMAIISAYEKPVEMNVDEWLDFMRGYDESDERPNIVVK